MGKIAKTVGITLLVADIAAFGYYFVGFKKCGSDMDLFLHHENLMLNKSLPPIEQIYHGMRALSLVDRYNKCTETYNSDVYKAIATGIVGLVSLYLAVGWQSINKR